MTTTSPRKYNLSDTLQSLDLSLDEAKAYYLKECNEHIVVCLNLRADSNIGTVVRTACIFSMKKVIIVGRKKYNAKATVGLHNYIPIEFVSATKGVHNEELDLDIVREFIGQFTDTHNVIFVEYSKDFETVPLNKMMSNIDKNRPTMFILGSEGSGIDSSLFSIEKTKIVSIPQNIGRMNNLDSSEDEIGFGRSLNVSNAFSMVVWEFFRREIF